MSLSAPINKNIIVNVEKYLTAFLAVVRRLHQLAVRNSPRETRREKLAARNSPQDPTPSGANLPRSYF